MFINLKILSKNKNSLEKFLILLNYFCIKKKEKNSHKLKKNFTKLPVEISEIEPTFYKFKAFTHKKIYKIKKRKYFIKKINGFLNCFQQKQKQKVFTTLKSPHVHKTAQEQIEYRVFSKQINIFSFQILKFLIFIKQIQIKICSDIKIHIKFILNNRIVLKNKLILLNPNNYKIKQYFLKKKTLIFYLKLFDVFGELNFNKLFG